MGYCIDNEQPLDILLLSERLTATRQLEEIGGPAFLVQLISNTPTSVHAPVYAHLVRRLHGRRQIIQLAETIRGIAANEASTVTDLVEAHQKLRVVLDRLTAVPSEPVGVVDVPQYHTTIQTAMDDPNSAQGIPTGFPALTQKLSGWQKSRLVEVAGFVHMGKSATLQAFALHAVSQNIPTLYCNVADSTKQDIIARMIAALSGVPSDTQTSGGMAPGQFTAYFEALSKFETFPLYIHDEIGMTTRKLSATIRSLQRRKGIRLVLVDYYQELQIHGRFTGRYEMLDRISQDLLAMAKEYDLPVVVGAQVRKSIENRADKRPQFNDTAECKRLEDRADVLLFVHREHVWDPLHSSSSVEFLIRKNRQVGQGGLGTVDAAFIETTGAIVPGQRWSIDLGKL
jgi:replicative DNA helicase